MQFFTSTWFDITHTHTKTHRTHKELIDWFSYKYTLIPSVKYLEQLSILHCMNNSLISKSYFAAFHNVFAFQKLLTCRSHKYFYWLDSIILSSFLETQSILTEMVQINKHANQALRER